jgi:hypothetical protein
MRALALNCNSNLLHLGLKFSLFRGIFHASELRILLAKLHASSSGNGGVVGIECEKKSKLIGWRSR